jgi:hypothetical protein
LDLQRLTGLSHGQLTTLACLVGRRMGAIVKPGGRPPALGLRDSVAMVVMLMRKNVTQEFAGGMFGVSQTTVSRRWDLIRPAIGAVLARFVPDPRQVIGAGSCLVDGMICPTWDWTAIPELYSGKAGFSGINLQVAGTLSGELAAIGPVPVPGARHDAVAFEVSGLKELLSDVHLVADSGYVGVDGVAVTPFKKPPKRELEPCQIDFNTDLSGIRAANERINAHVKTWRMLSEEGGRYRCPIEKYACMLKAVIGLIFFKVAFE